MFDMTLSQDLADFGRRAEPAVDNILVTLGQEGDWCDRLRAASGTSHLRSRAGRWRSRHAEHGLQKLCQCGQRRQPDGSRRQPLRAPRLG